MSLSKNAIKLINSLTQKKYRQKYNIFAAEGSKLCAELLKSSRYRVNRIYCLSSWLESHQDSFPSSAEWIEISAKEMKKITTLKTIPEVILLVDIPIKNGEELNITNGVHMYLDDVQDPGNVGSLIRSAEWFGCRSVIRSLGSADFYNSKVIQATMGAFINIDLCSLSQEKLIHLQPSIIATDMAGKSIYSSSKIKDGVVVISNEGQGISAIIKENATEVVSIPPKNHSKSNSLNASVAGGIILSYLCE